LRYSWIEADKLLLKVVKVSNVGDLKKLIKLSD